MFPRLKFRTAGAGESTPGKFTHTPPKNAPRYDLRKPKHLPDPMLRLTIPCWTSTIRCSSWKVRSSHFRVPLRSGVFNAVDRNG